MPVLKNSRHELFCQALSQGMTQEQAYIAAKYKKSPDARIHASRLATKDHIRLRVTELMSRNVTRTAEMAAITTQRLLEMAEEARALAMEEKQPAAAVTALTAIAKLSGLWVERSEQLHKASDLSEMSDAELAEIVRGGQLDTPLKPLN
jgi:hypothetical protein